MSTELATLDISAVTAVTVYGTPQGVDNVLAQITTAARKAVADADISTPGGREAIPPRWLMSVLACRALPEAGALRPRPIECWPDDALEVAEALLMARSS